MDAESVADRSQDDRVSVMPGRNDPCHCGSGKKYKRCHLPQDEARLRSGPADDSGVLPPEALEELQAITAERQAHEARGYYLPHIELEWKGHRVRAVGSTLHFRPPTETFDEFMITLLIQTLGEKWFRTERSKPASARHFVMQCYDRYHAWKARSATEANRHGSGWRMAPDGWTRTLYALGVDVYSLLHRGKLPKRLINRLAHPEQYQGARYEVAIAGLFVRLGCSVEFLDRSTSEEQEAHCEFIATHERTGTVVGVEAKSRHRPGVLGRGGVAPAPHDIHAGIDALIQSALAQAPPDKPFIVFVDANAPMDIRSGEPRPWVAEVEQLLGAMDRGAPTSPTKWNALVVTNFAFHYATEREAERGQFAATAARHPRFALPTAGFYELLQQGLMNHGEVPPLA